MVYHLPLGLGVSLGWEPFNVKTGPAVSKLWQCYPLFLPWDMWQLLLTHANTLSTTYSFLIKNDCMHITRCLENIKSTNDKTYQPSTTVMETFAMTLWCTYVQSFFVDLLSLIPYFKSPEYSFQHNNIYEIIFESNESLVWFISFHIPEIWPWTVTQSVKFRTSSKFSIRGLNVCLAGNPFLK